MSQEELKMLAKLSTREKQVLGLVCDGNLYEDIAKKLFISEPTVRATMGRVYVKLELDQLTTPEKRSRIHQIFCPLLKGAELPPETPDAEIPIPVPANVAKMVDDDENYIIPYQPLKPDVIYIKPNPPQKHTRKGLIGPAIGGIIGAGLCLCIVAVLVFLYWNQNKSQFAVSPNQPDSQPTQPSAQVINPTEPPQVIVVTATSLPEANTSVPAPTSAPVIVSTTVPAPVISLPFSDNFASGPNQQWKVLSGNWITANGRYTITPADGWAFVALDDPTWKNYKVHANIMVPHLGAGSQGQVGIFVRINKSPYLGFVENSITRVSWGILKPSDLYLSDIAGNQRVSIDKTFNLDLEVNGNNYIARLNGQEIQRISMSGYDSGGIALGIMCNISSPCESFSDVRVDPLP